MGKHKSVVKDKALDAAEGLWPMNLNIQELELEIEVHFNADNNTFDLIYDGQSYAQLPFDDHFYFPETRTCKLSGLIKINDKTILDTNIP